MNLASGENQPLESNAKPVERAVLPAPAAESASLPPVPAGEVKPAEEAGPRYVEPELTKSRPTYQEFARILARALASREDVEMLSVEKLCYDVPPKGPREYDFLKIQSKDIGPEDKLLLIRAGIHGNEIGAPLSVLRQINEMIDYAHSHGVKVVIFPLDNPSGYEDMTRVNAHVKHHKIDDADGWHGNNNIVLYELADGTIADDMGDGTDPKTGEKFNITGWRWSDEVQEFGDYLPNETLALLRQLKQIPVNQLAGILDLHQDGWCDRPMTYQFTFGNDQGFEGVLKDPVFKKVNLDPAAGPVEDKAMPGPHQALLVTNHYNENHPFAITGYDPTKFIVAGDKSKEFEEKSNGYGSILHHDGTLPCLLYQAGSGNDKYRAVTLETTTVTPQDVVDRITMAWVRGLVDSIAHDHGLLK